MPNSSDTMYKSRSVERDKRRRRLDSKGVKVDTRLTEEEARAIKGKVFAIQIPNNDELEVTDLQG